jgi:tetratricopeptide (TPR) repeat protein
MDFTVQPLLYQQLEQHLQSIWQAKQLLPATIRCGSRQNRLLILVEHDADVALNPPDAFAHLQAWLSELPVELKAILAGSDQSTAALYVRIKSHKQPYAGKLYKAPPETILPGSDHPAPVTPPDPAFQTSTSTAFGPDNSSRVTPGIISASIDPDAQPDSPGSQLDEESLRRALPESLDELNRNADRRTDPLEDLSGDEPFPTVNGVELEFEEEPPLKREAFYVPMGVWAAGLGLCLTTFAGSFYLVSQPCLVRTCLPFEAAQRIGTSVTQMLQAANTWEDLERARSQLGLANLQLDRVPSWSRYGLQAQQQRSRYQSLALAIEPMQAALKQATLATQKTQGDALPIDSWREIAKIWDSVISQLKAIPSNSPLYSMAQDKLRQFQASQRQVEQRLTKEQEGQRLLVEARRLAAPLSDPTTLSDLEGTQSRLQQVVELLNAIPKATTAYEDAQQILATYESQLAAATNQQSQQQQAIDDYRRATEIASEARRLETQQEWSSATEQWQAAIASLQGIGISSPNYSEAQGQLGEYTIALKQAEQRASRSGAVAQARTALDGICSGTPTICTVEVTPDRIAVRLTAAYQQAVLTAGTIGDADSKVQAVDHVKTLELALQTTSDNARIPLELYDPDGTLVGTHSPLKP